MVRCGSIALPFFCKLELWRDAEEIALRHWKKIILNVGLGATCPNCGPLLEFSKCHFLLWHGAPLTIMGPTRVLRDFSTAIFKKDGSKLAHILPEAASSNKTVDIQDAKICFSNNTLPDGFSVNKGDMVSYQPYAMERMKFIWVDDVEEYKSKRWLDGASKFTALQYAKGFLRPSWFKMPIPVRASIRVMIKLVYQSTDHGPRIVPLYSGSERRRNGVGILVDEELRGLTVDLADLQVLGGPLSAPSSQGSDSFFRPSYNGQVGGPSRGPSGQDRMSRLWPSSNGRLGGPSVPDGPSL
ncbi:hypothetical protein FXO38_02503 [Capsicum annuum]|nr:hypothetical protein FXO38_02503 [Capsicum annuum]KAF3682121.1 hypothetical protein FXO37_02516 [Capsicum annuum]